jgi:protein N-terminal glutamine amidohydrolase
MGSIFEDLCSDYDYCSHYCEENVAKLAERFLDVSAKSLPSGNASLAFVVFVSNNAKQTPIWNQKLSASDDDPVIWDYHVIFVLYDSGLSNTARKENLFVIDCDTRLGLPVPFADYVDRSFRPSFCLSKTFQQ